MLRSNDSFYAPSFVSPPRIHLRYALRYVSVWFGNREFNKWYHSPSVYLFHFNAQFYIGLFIALSFYRSIAHDIVAVFLALNFNQTSARKTLIGPCKLIN